MGNHKVLKTAGMNLRYSMYDFIDAVKKHHIIWDREHKNFHNRELRDLAWQQIGQQLCKNFDTSSEPEKQEITKTLLKRWKNTRDSYLRVNRLRQSGEEISRASYIYEKELCFLLDVKTEDEETIKAEKPALKRKQYRSQRTYSKRRRELESHSPVQLNNEATTVGNTLAEDGLQTVLDTLNYSTDTTSTFPVGAKVDAASPSPHIDPHNANIATTTTNPAAAVTAGTTADPDPDQAFFDSIKPHMQRMSSDQKLDFQIEVLKILRNFKPK